MDRSHVNVRVWGDFACFTRPEFKVERVSYPMITPSAARGVLEAIYWKPEFRYEIRRIGVVKMGSQMVILRNEIADRQGKLPILIEEKRQQRSSLILRDVEYLIQADVVLRPHVRDSIAKYLDQLRRRLARGQCFHTPYLGTREFAASFEPGSNQSPEDLNTHLGNMLFDIAFIESAHRQETDFRLPGRGTAVSGFAHALFIPDARLNQGWWEIQPDQYKELYQREIGDV